MSLSDPYLDAADFRARTGQTDTTQDDVIDAVILAASRQIDGWCGQAFGQSDMDETRYFSARFDDVLTIPPLVTLTTLATDRGNGLYDVTWTTTDYVLHPRNAAAAAEPFTEARRAWNGRYVFPIWTDSVAITGIWGWPAIPAQVVEATYLIANRLKSLWNAPFGQTGSGDMGGGLNMTAALDPIIKAMLAPYRVVTT